MGSRTPGGGFLRPMFRLTPRRKWLLGAVIGLYLTGLAVECHANYHFHPTPEEVEEQLQKWCSGRFRREDFSLTGVPIPTRRFFTASDWYYHYRNSEGTIELELIIESDGDSFFMSSYTMPSFTAEGE